MDVFKGKLIYLTQRTIRKPTLTDDFRKMNVLISCPNYRLLFISSLLQGTIKALQIVTCTHKFN